MVSWRMQLVEQRPWSDWIGLVAYTGLALLLWSQSTEWGLLMLPTICHELLVAGAFLTRSRARRTLPGWPPRLVGYAHTFLILLFLQIASRWFPDWVRPTPSVPVRLAGGYLWLAATLLGLWPLWYLRRSFSLEPQARSLVTSGPYRLSRHPIYAVYALTFTGLWLRSITLPFTLVLAAWLVLLFARMRYEEEVLGLAFPEYADYRRRVGALAPRLLGPRS
jgi:protein-S-isoprenylcysteine O-methyltransferase Ste14